MIKVIRSREAPSTTPPVIEQARRKQYSPDGTARARSNGTESPSTASVATANSNPISEAVRSQTSEHTCPPPSPAPATQNVARAEPEPSHTDAAPVATAPSIETVSTGPRRPGQRMSVRKATTAVPAAQYAASRATWSIIGPPRRGPAPGPTTRRARARGPSQRRAPAAPTVPTTPAPPARVAAATASPPPAMAGPG